MAITLYHSPMSSSSRVVWALEELGIPYERVRLHLDKNEQKAPDYLKINPNGKVPALVDGEVKIFESIAIVLHLGERYGVDKGLWPAPLSAERAEALSWTIWSTTEVQPAVVSYVMHTGERRFSFSKEQRHQPTVQMAKKSWEDTTSILDDRLGGREWLVGGRFTFADLALGSVMGFATMMAGLSLDGRANVQAWTARCQQRPAFGRAMSI
jgi:glutathione S-transferase